MRVKKSFNNDWLFARTGEIPESMPDQNDSKWEAVTLPHTWNALDGQDGGNDYWRGTACYVKEFDTPELEENGRAILEFNAAAMTAEVFVNGQKLAHHEGGFSAFRVDITDALKSGRNLLAVTVDNSENDHVYPQKADFTFYGGLYRNVNLITVSGEHFELIDSGTPGIKVTPKVNDDGSVDVKVELQCVGGDKVQVSIRGQENVASTNFSEEGNRAAGSNDIAEHLPNFSDGAYRRTEKSEINRSGKADCSGTAVIENGMVSISFHITDPHLWNGKKDPYLYTAEAELLNADGTVKDTVSTRFGIRSFRVDPEKGFILNGKSYPLRGVSMHQDLKGKGNALTLEDMQNNMAVVNDIGANTLRLAHYQHAQEFLDLCDENGIAVWAEIPMITMFMENGRENTLSMMRELVTQCYNHPSIICWGLSNEITAAGTVNDSLLENHRALNDLCHRLDPTRPTTMANVFMLEMDSPIHEIPDIQSYNLYFGWYLGELSQNDQFFDAFHAKYPDRAIGFSEYGADANRAFHSSHPDRGDYTEEYQCIYHEHMLKMIEKRPYLWATHVWNLFDFAADGRDEGGKKGENQKGLVEFDHRTRKDAFYLYKAAWNHEDPFVHICSKGYVNRAEEETAVKVYSNLPAVTLYVDGQDLGTLTGDRIFTWKVKLDNSDPEHEYQIEAGAAADLTKFRQAGYQSTGAESACGNDFSNAAGRGNHEQILTDSAVIRRVETPDPSYSLTGQAPVTNWFDEPYKPECFSIDDTIGEIMQNPKAAALFAELSKKAVASRGDVAKASSSNQNLQKMLANMSLKRMLLAAGPDVANEEQIKALNRALQQIRK